MIFAPSPGLLLQRVTAMGPRQQADSFSASVSAEASLARRFLTTRRESEAADARGPASSGETLATHCFSKADGHSSPSFHQGDANHHERTPLQLEAECLGKEIGKYDDLSFVSPPPPLLGFFILGLIAGLLIALFAYWVYRIRRVPEDE